MKSKPSEPSFMMSLKDGRLFQKDICNIRKELLAAWKSPILDTPKTFEQNMKYLYSDLHHY